MRADAVAAVARRVRADLLSRAETPRDLAGQCGLVSMLVAAAIDDPRILRTGFFMKRSSLCGRRGRWPHRHAWCQVDDTIVDATASQFGKSLPAVHVTCVLKDDRYVEADAGRDAVDDIMTNWRGRELPAYRQLAKKLRKIAQEGPR